MNLDSFREDLKICARCGFCKNVCPTHKFSDGFEDTSPRGRLYFLAEYVQGKESLTPEWVDRLYRCTSRERCMEVCQTQIPLVPLWEAARARTVKMGLGPMPAHKRLRDAVKKFFNPYGEPLEKQRDWMLDGMQEAKSAEIFVFGGCTASYRVPNMLRTGIQILQKANIPYMYRGGEEYCCASPILRTGQVEAAEALIKHNIELIAQSKAKYVVTPCGGCSKTLKHDYPVWAKKLGLTWNVKVMHFCEIYARLIEEGQIKIQKEINKVITYHDPCHVGRAQGLFEEPRAIIKAIPGLKLLEMEHHGPDSRCCGAGGGVKSNYPKLADQICQDRVKEAMETGAEMLATMCPFCQGSFNQAVKALNVPLEVAGVDALLLEAMEG
ncbi:MAG: (Fe-S)-binding protein [Desulfovibrionaceae bacterium]|nr:(Fe-S)-binding protein [Desulfovibrionaceae bacterium]